MVHQGEAMHKMEGEVMVLQGEVMRLNEAVTLLKEVVTGLLEVVMQDHIEDKVIWVVEWEEAQ